MDTNQRLQIEGAELRRMGVSGQVPIFPRMITAAQDDLLDATSHLDVDSLIDALQWMRTLAKVSVDGGASPETLAKLAKINSLLGWLQEVAAERL